MKLIHVDFLSERSLLFNNFETSATVLIGTFLPFELTASLNLISLSVNVEKAESTPPLVIETFDNNFSSTSDNKCFLVLKIKSKALWYSFNDLSVK